MIITPAEAKFLMKIDGYLSVERDGGFFAPTEDDRPILHRGPSAASIKFLKKIAKDGGRTATGIYLSAQDAEYWQEAYTCYLDRLGCNGVGAIYFRHPNEPAGYTFLQCRLKGEVEMRS